MGRSIGPPRLRAPASLRGSRGEQLRGPGALPGLLRGAHRAGPAAGSGEAEDRGGGRRNQKGGDVGDVGDGGGRGRLVRCQTGGGGGWWGGGEDGGHLALCGGRNRVSIYLLPRRDWRSYQLCLRSGEVPLGMEGQTVKGKKGSPKSNVLFAQMVPKKRYLNSFCHINGHCSNSD